MVVSRKKYLLTGLRSELEYEKVKPFIPDVIKSAKSELKSLKKGLKNEMGCQPVSPFGAKNGCELDIRFLQQINRTKEPESVFAQFAVAFSLADQTDEVVGLNLVAPEDDEWHCEIIPCTWK